MNNTITIEALGKTDPIDTLKFDDADTASVDLTEIIDYDKQLKVTHVVSGTENYLTTGKLDSTTALYLGVQTRATNMDPLGSVYNARFGGEGFFETTLKALENGIMAVIRFIKKIALWVVDKIKILFGIKPSDRQAAAVKEKMPELKQQIGAYLVALGFPTHLVDLDKFLADMPDARFNTQIKFMASKLVDKEVYLTKFTEIPPLIQNVCRVIANGTKRAKMAKKRFSDKLDYIARQSKSPTFDFAYEGGQLRELILEVIRALNYKEIIPELSKLLEIVVGQALPAGDDFSAKSVEIAQQVTAAITTAQQAADVEFVRKIEQILSKTTVENFEKLNEQRVDMSDAMKDLYHMVDASEVNKVAVLADLSKDGRYMAFYREMTGAVNVFTNFAKVTVEILRLAGTTFSDLGGWYSKATTFMLAAVANDVDTISKLMLEAQQKALKAGRPFTVDMYPNGMPKLVAIPEAEAQTAMEKMADVSSLVIQENIFNVKSAVNNFSRDIGAGKIL